MRKTLTLTLDQETARFICQDPVMDPSALINQLFHQDMTRRGIQIDPEYKTRMKDEMIQAFELYLDEDTPAAD